MSDQVPLFHGGDDQCGGVKRGPRVQRPEVISQLCDLEQVPQFIIVLVFLPMDRNGQHSD